MQEALNENDEHDNPVYEFNAQWYGNLRESYWDLVERSDEKLEKLVLPAAVETENVVKSKQDGEAVLPKVTEERKMGFLKNIIEDKKDCIKEAVNKLVETVNSCPDNTITPSQTVVYQ